MRRPSSSSYSPTSSSYLLSTACGHSGAARRSYDRSRVAIRGWFYLRRVAHQGVEPLAHGTHRLKRRVEDNGILKKGLTYRLSGVI